MPQKNPDTQVNKHKTTSVHFSCTHIKTGTIRKINLAPEQGWHANSRHATYLLKGGWMPNWVGRIIGRFWGVLGKGKTWSKYIIQENF